MTDTHNKAHDDAMESYLLSCAYLAINFPVTPEAYRQWHETQAAGEDRNHPPTKRFFEEIEAGMDSPHNFQLDIALRITSTITQLDEEQQKQRLIEINGLVKNLAVALWENDASTIATARDAVEKIMAEVLLVAPGRAKEETDTMIRCFDEEICRFKGTDVQHVPPITFPEQTEEEKARWKADMDRENNLRKEYQRAKENALAAIKFPVSEELFAAHLARIGELLKDATNPEEIAQLNQQQKLEEKDGKPVLSFLQAQDAFIAKDSEEVRKGLAPAYDDDEEPQSERYLAFFKSMSALERTFWPDCLYREELLKTRWDQADIDWYAREFANQLYDPAQKNNVATGEWQAKSIAEQVAEALQDARAAALGQSRTR